MFCWDKKNKFLRLEDSEDIATSTPRSPRSPEVPDSPPPAPPTNHLRFRGIGRSPEAPPPPPTEQPRPSRTFGAKGSLEKSASRAPRQPVSSPSSRIPVSSPSFRIPVSSPKSWIPDTVPCQASLPVSWPTTVTSHKSQIPIAVSLLNRGTFCSVFLGDSVFLLTV